MSYSQVAAAAMKSGGGGVGGGGGLGGGLGGLNLGMSENNNIVCPEIL